MTEQSERLNKYLALRLGVSRREADELIASGKVNINGAQAELGAKVTDGDAVTVGEKSVTNEFLHTYIVLNKPVGYVCSRRAQGDNPTIYDLLPADLHHLKPVGRLDKDSSGILLLTNDGDFAHQMTHPSFAKTKIYQVRLDKALEPLHQQMIADYGVDIGDGTSKLALERVNNARKDWIVTMKEGRNRQIRRTFAALGYDVTGLHRIQFGRYDLGELEAGHYDTFMP